MSACFTAVPPHALLCLVLALCVSLGRSCHLIRHVVVPLGCSGIFYQFPCDVAEVK